ncbi:MAG: cytidine deaminase [Clostridia bacterium]|nr:cytidine deaminase [Clostridia bacterium]
MTENKTTSRSLALAAIEAMKKSYSPYSSFTVGAALLTKDGKVYTGANIENASYTPTICAERNAIFTAVHAGEREFEAIAIVGGHKGEITGVTVPCGVCRQVMSEFCSPDFKVILVTSPEGDFEETTLGELLPYTFKL